jgi:hypothetical protein
MFEASRKIENSNNANNTNEPEWAWLSLLAEQQTKLVRVGPKSMSVSEVYAKRPSESADTRPRDRSVKSEEELKIKEVIKKGQSYAKSLKEAFVLNELDKHDSWWWICNELSLPQIPSPWAADGKVTLTDLKNIRIDDKSFTGLGKNMNTVLGLIDDWDKPCANLLKDRSGCISQETLDKALKIDPDRAISIIDVLRQPQIREKLFANDGNLTEQLLGEFIDGTEFAKLDVTSQKALLLLKGGWHDDPFIALLLDENDGSIHSELARRVGIWKSDKVS